MTDTLRQMIAEIIRMRFCFHDKADHGYHHLCLERADEASEEIVALIRQTTKTDSGFDSKTTLELHIDEEK